MMNHAGSKRLFFVANPDDDMPRAAPPLSPPPNHNFRSLPPIATSQPPMSSYLSSGSTSSRSSPIVDQPSPITSESPSNEALRPAPFDHVVLLATCGQDHYTSVVVTGATGGAYIRELIFSKLKIPDEDHSITKIYRTELGEQRAIGDALDDDQLFSVCKTNGDAHGTLKFLLQSTSFPSSSSVIAPPASQTSPLIPPASIHRLGTNGSVSDGPGGEGTGYEASISDIDHDFAEQRGHPRAGPSTYHSKPQKQSNVYLRSRSRGSSSSLDNGLNSPVRDTVSYGKSSRVDSPETPPSTTLSVPQPAPLRVGSVTPTALPRSSHAPPPPSSLRLSPTSSPLPPLSKHLRPSGRHGRESSDPLRPSDRSEADKSQRVDRRKVTLAPSRYGDITSGTDQNETERERMERGMQIPRSTSSQGYRAPQPWSSTPSRPEPIQASSPIYSPRPTHAPRQWGPAPAHPPPPPPTNQEPYPLPPHIIQSRPQVPYASTRPSNGLPPGAYDPRMEQQNQKNGRPTYSAHPASFLSMGNPSISRPQLLSPRGRGTKQIVGARSFENLQAPRIATRLPFGPSVPSNNRPPPNMTHNHSAAPLRVDSTSLYIHQQNSSGSSTTSPIGTLPNFAGRNDLIPSSRAGNGPGHSPIKQRRTSTADENPPVVRSRNQISRQPPLQASSSPYVRARANQYPASPPASTHSEAGIESYIPQPLQQPSYQNQQPPSSLPSCPDTYARADSPVLGHDLEDHPPKLFAEPSRPQYGGILNTKSGGLGIPQVGRSASEGSGNPAAHNPSSTRSSRPPISPTATRAVSAGATVQSERDQNHTFSNDEGATMIPPPRRVDPTPAPMPTPPRTPSNVARPTVTITHNPHPIFSRDYGNESSDTDDSSEENGTIFVSKPPSKPVVTIDTAPTPSTLSAKDSPMVSSHHPPRPLPPPPPLSGQQSHLGPSVVSHDRRTSFDSHASWKFRPPAEDVYDRLEEFFPDHNLDEPMIDAASGGSSPTTEQPVPALPPHVVAKRGHKKSIRLVAAERKKMLDRANTSKVEAKESTILRRRSTKLWGSRVEELTPHGGTIGPPSVPTIPESPHVGGLQQPITFKWVKGDLIGRGTYGRVYLALNATTGEMLAVKQVEMPRTISDQDDSRQIAFVEALKAESDTLRDLDHPHIVQYLGLEETTDFMSIFLEYVPGGSVGSCLRRHGKFEENLIKSFTSQILDGLAYLHSVGVLHRDLKADNILVDPYGVCKISDFGISKKTDDVYDNNSYTAMQGSIFWMAPEVVHNQRQGYSAKIDIWSLGCVVLEMWAGTRPWNREDMIAVMFKLGSSRQAPPIPDGVVLSPQADDFRQKCFAIDPNERPTAAQLFTHPFLKLDPSWIFTGFSTLPTTSPAS